MPPVLKPQRFQILLALSRGPLHGAAIMEEVLERTDGAMKLWPASLYGALRDMEELGWILETVPGVDAPHEGGKRRFHRLTDAGVRVLREELDRMRRLLDVADARDLLREAGGKG